jgi:hypothetical protein
VAGAAASALWARGLLSVGASTALFGLFGAYAVISWRYRGSLPAGIRQSNRWWMVILGINAALPLLIPQVDIAAHAGGFIAGLVVASLLLPALPEIGREVRPGAMVQLAAGLMVVLFVAGIARQVASQHTGFQRTLPLELAQQQQRLSPDLLNNLAWEEAIARDSNEQRLALAEDAAERAVAADPDQPAFVDTLATVCYRRRQLARAISLERQALALDSSSEIYPSQLARFLRAHHEQEGVLVLGGATAGDARASKGTAGTWVVEMTAGLPQGSSVHATVLNRRQQLHGLLRVCKTSAEAGPVTIGLDADAETVVTVALIDATGSDCRDGDSPVRFWPFHPDVAALP